MCDDIDREEWRPVMGVPGYDVSNLGRVRSYYPPRGDISDIPRMLNTTLKDGGMYVVVTLRQSKSKKKRHINAYVHRLVAEVFHGERPDGMEISHIDDDKRNNRVDNLIYETHGDNMRRGVKNRVRYGGVRMKRNSVRTTIDIPDDIYIEVKAIAKEEHRSMRKQIAYWLQIAVMRYKAKQADWAGYDMGEVENDE